MADENPTRKRRRSQISEIPAGPGLVDVSGGSRAYPRLADHLVGLASRVYQPARVLIIGLADDQQSLQEELAEAGLEKDVPPADKFSFAAPHDPHPLAGEVEFCLANPDDAAALVRLCQADDGPTVLVTLFQAHHEEYLPMVLEECPSLAVYAVDLTDSGDDFQVRFEKRIAAAALAPSIPNIPEDAMYGRAYALAKSLQCPMGFAYPSTLAAACGAGIVAGGGVRPTLYAVNLGDVGTGKSVAKNRAGQLFFGADPEDRSQVAQDERWVYKVPASDRGLYALLDAQGRPRALAQDELRNMMGKGSIEGATLMSLLCELWNSNVAGVADKKGPVGVNVRLSLLGCLKVSSPAEFRKVFDYSSAHGFYDRCVFGIEPQNSWHWTDARVERGEFDPTAPSVPLSAYERVNAWKKEAQGRGRLGELALRVAYVASAVNRDSEVSEKALYAAIKFGEWQEKIRRYFQPAQGEDKTDQLVAEVEKVFGQLPGREGSWRDVSRNNNWHRDFGRIVTQTKAMLEKQGVLIYDKKKKTHRLYVAG